MMLNLALPLAVHANGLVLPDSCFCDTSWSTHCQRCFNITKSDGARQTEEIETQMTYIVNDNCINCKYTDCVEVCPVDCFYEGENMLVIHPDECIDCGVCEPECPPEAILPDSEPGAEKWLELNREMSEIWPNIEQKIDAMPDAEKMRDESGKYEKYFSKAPGAGA